MITEIVTISKILTCLSHLGDQVFQLREEQLIGLATIAVWIKLTKLQAQLPLSELPLHDLLVVARQGGAASVLVLIQKLK